MMESNQIKPSPEGTEQAATTVSCWRIFFEPSRYFEGLNIKPRFIIPLLLIILISLASSLVLTSRVDMAEVIRNQIESSAAGEQLTPEQINQQVAMMSKFTRIMAIVGPIVYFPLATLLIAGLIMLGIYVSGGDIKGGEALEKTGSGGGFSRIFAVATGAMFFYAMVSSVLTMVVLLLASNPNSVDINNPLFTNPAGLVDPKNAKALYTLLTRVDILDWYTIFLMGLGLSKVVNKCSVGKGILVVGFWYVLYSAIVTGLAMLF